MNPNLRLVFFRFFIAFLVTGCNEVNAVQTVEQSHVPRPVDYSDATMWHVELNDRGDGADVFYIPSTWEFDWTTTDGRICHYADPSISKHHDDVEIEMMWRLR